MPYSRSRFLGFAVAGTAISVPAIARSQTGPTIRCATVANDGYVEPYYALEQGFFQRAGLNVDVQMFSSGARITDGIVAGALDVGISNPISLANAVDHGLPMSFFAGGVMYNRDAIALCVAPDSPIKTAKDLNRKTIATTALKDSNSLHVQAWVDQNGGDSSTLEFVEIPFSAMAAAVARGTVAAAPIAEPALSVAVRDGMLRVAAHTMDAYGRTFMVGGWMARSDWIANNRELLRKFTDAIYSTARWANSHRDETALIFAKYGKLDLAVVRAMHRSGNAVSLSPAMFQPHLDLGFMYKYLSRHYDASALIAKV